MYLAIDIGGTKTLVASLTNEGVIIERLRFETPKKYDEFLKLLAENVANISTKDFLACGVGIPGRMNQERRICIATTNLPWRNVPIYHDVKRVVPCPVVVENDAKLAGLSEAMLLKDKHQKVLFVTISTGIGIGLIRNQVIDPALADSESGQVLVEHQGKMTHWEEVASGKAIVSQYGKKAKDITDAHTWEQIAYKIGIGISDLISVIQPDVIVVGGSVGEYFDRYKEPLLRTLHRYESPTTKVPPVIGASRPADAVLYGCYDLAKSTYGKTS